MSDRVAGKIAVVTGAGTGIGRAVALRLAAEGAHVIVASRTSSHVDETRELVERASGRTSLGLTFDVRSQGDVDAVVSQVRDEFGRIDILSNNVGIDDPVEPSVAETSDAAWMSAFDVNLTGVFRVCRSAIPVLAERGAVVNMGSVAGIVPRSNAAAYCASKAALLQFTRSLALELAPRKIRVNCVCPGVVDTPLTDLFLTQTSDITALQRKYAGSNPLNRIAAPEEIANCVLFLASDEASFVTGTSLVADGGKLAGTEA